MYQNSLLSCSGPEAIIPRRAHIKASFLPMLHMDTKIHTFTVGNANSPTAYRQHRGRCTFCWNFLQWDESSGNRVRDKRKHFRTCGILTTTHSTAIDEQLGIVFLIPSFFAVIYVTQLCWIFKKKPLTLFYKRL